LSAYHVEFKVSGISPAVWESAYGTYSTEAEARKAMRANKRELRAEGNPVGKFRVREGRGSRSSMSSINWAQWSLIGLASFVFWRTSQ
jgi:hypothetical protein